jgi:hypothetical protein
MKSQPRGRPLQPLQPLKPLRPSDYKLGQATIAKKKNLFSENKFFADNQRLFQTIFEVAGTRS